MRICIVLFFSFFLCFSQKLEKKQLDSLIVVLNKKKINYVEKIEVLNTLTLNYGNFDLNQSKKFNNKIYILSKKNNYLRGLGYYYHNISNECVYLGEFQKAEKYGSIAKVYFAKVNDYNNYIISVYNICFAKEMLGGKENYDAAERLALETIKKFEDKPNTRLVELYYYLSTAFNNEKKPRIAFLYMNKATDMYRKENDQNGVFVCNRQLAHICLVNDMYQNSVKYLNEFPDTSSIFVSSSFQNKLRTYELYLTNYIKLKDYKNALLYCEKFNKVANAAKIDLEIKLASIFFAEIYTKLKQYNKAKYFLSKLDVQENDDWEKMQINTTKGILYYGLKDYEKSLYYRKLNYELDKEDIENIKSLAETEFQLHNYKKAFEYLKVHLNGKVENLKKEKESNIYEYEALYKLRDKEFALQKSKLETAKNEIALQKQKGFTFFFIIISIALVFIFILLMYNYKIKQKSNRLLEDKNEDLITTNHLLGNSIIEKEILLKEIHHRVKNNLQLVMSLLNIQAQDTQNITINDFLEKGQSRIAAMSLIHQNLYQTENFTQINFQVYLLNLIENIQQSFSNNNVEYEIKTNGNNFDLDTAIPLGLIINELVCNALKHAFPTDLKGKIEIEIQKNESNIYQLKIGDNGIGAKNTVKSTKSIGLELVTLLVLQLKGTINKLDQLGTNYSIEFKESLS